MAVGLDARFSLEPIGQHCKPSAQTRRGKRKLAKVWDMAFSATLPYGCGCDCNAHTHTHAMAPDPLSTTSKHLMPGTGAANIRIIFKACTMQSNAPHVLPLRAPLHPIQINCHTAIVTQSELAFERIQEQQAPKQYHQYGGYWQW